MATHVCIKSCFHRRNFYKAGDPYEPTGQEIKDGKIPHHFVETQAYAKQVAEAKKKAHEEAVKNAKQAMRDTRDPEKWKEHQKPTKDAKVAGPDPDRYCKLCDKEYVSPEGLAVHMKTKHPQPKEG